MSTNLSFAELVSSRREWIDQILIPWCRSAPRRELLLAEQAWPDLAGRPDPSLTLWLWAWQRFPELCEEGLTAINEAWPVQVHLSSGETVLGYPDARQSLRGELILVGLKGETQGPYAIDDIQKVVRHQELIE